MQKLILLYFILINLAAFVLFTFDKYKSRVNASRTPEKRLHTLSLLGGVLGASLSMILFRHKIKKSSFMLKHLAIVFLWIALFVYYFSQVDDLNFLR